MNTRKKSAPYLGRSETLTRQRFERKAHMKLGTTSRLRKNTSKVIGFLESFSGAALYSVWRGFASCPWLPGIGYPTEYSSPRVVSHYSVLRKLSTSQCRHFTGTHPPFYTTVL